MEVNILNEREQVYRSSDAPKPIKKITELTEREVVYYKSSDPKADCDNFVDMYEEDYIVEEDIGINIPNVEKCPSKCNSQNTVIVSDGVIDLGSFTGVIGKEFVPLILDRINSLVEDETKYGKYTFSIRNSDSKQELIYSKTGQSRTLTIYGSLLSEILNQEDNIIDNITSTRRTCVECSLNSNISGLGIGVWYEKEAPIINDFADWKEYYFDGSNEDPSPLNSQLFGAGEVIKMGQMLDQKIQANAIELEKLDKHDEKLQEQIDVNHSEVSEVIQELYDDVEKNYSKRSDSINHFTITPTVTSDNLSLLYEGIYADSVNGNHLFGPHNIELLRSGQTIKTINEQSILGKGNLKIDIPEIDTSEIDAKLEIMQKTIGTHNKEVRFFGIEPVTVKVGDTEYYCEANQVSTVFVGDEDFEIIPTSNNSIQSLLGYPIPLKWFDWLEGVEVFDGIVFDMNELSTYHHWIQYHQGDYHVQKAQYSNCVFWSDKPYTHSPFEERTNYTIYYSSQLPLCYSQIPENTYKPFYLSYGVNSDPNWRNPDYVNSYSLVSGATQTFSYYGATAIGIFDMAVDVITLPKDCRGLMYHAPAITHAGVFDATKTTNFGAKKGSWQEAFGDCISLTSLYIQNLKTSINISWSPINVDSIEFIVNNAINTSTITISVSPYTWNIISDELIATAKAKNINIVLLEGNMPNDKRWDKLSNSVNNNTTDLNNIKQGTLVVAKAEEAEKDSDGKIIKDTYAKQEDYNYTLGTALATSELGGYLNISHNYNKTLAIPYATENNGGVISAEDKSKLNNININSPIAYAVYADTSTDVEVTTISGYFPTELVAGARITINIRGNISLIKTLNVNGTGAKNVYYAGSSLTGGMIDRYNVYDFIYDGTYYRIIGVDTDSNTHYTAKLVAGASNTSKTNDNAENGNVYLNVVENSTVRSSHNIVGEGDVSVRSDATGRIIIESCVEETLGLDVTNLFSEGSSILGNISDLITKQLYTKDSNGNLTYPVTFYPHGDTEDNISSSVGYLYREHITQVSEQISTKKYIATIRQNGSYIVCDAVDSRTSTL